VRARRIFDRALPVRLGWGADFVQIRFNAWLALPLLALLGALRQWDQVKLLLFYTPTSLPPLLIYSRNGYTNPTAFHMMAFALLACWALHAALHVVARARGAKQPEAA